jgi:hypothetical protein
MKKLMVVALTLMVMLCFGAISFAGSLDSPAAPDSPGSAMFTLEDIYQYLNAGTEPIKRTTPFAEPSSGPTGGTGHTLDEVMALVKTECGGGSAPVAKTGQTTSYATGDDGNLTKGVAWPIPRFSSGNGTVTDNLTGLIWLQNANCFGSGNWTKALSFANGLADGTCSLTDGSSAGDWRLPNIKELLSLVDYSNFNPALQAEHPFSNVQNGDRYWSSTTYVKSSGDAHAVYIYDGTVYNYGKSIDRRIWPVRGGQ